MPADNDVLPATIAVGLLQAARTRGLPHEQWLARLGLSATALETADATLTYRQSIRLIECAVADAPDLPLGIEVGTRAALTPMGMLGFAMMSSRTVRDAVEFSMSHHRAAGSLLDFLVQTEGNQGRLLVTERKAEPQVRAFLFEEFLSSVHLLIQAMLGEDWRPLAIEWPHAEPGYGAAYRRIFSCPQRFATGRCALSFDPGLLDRPLKNHSETNLRLAQQACRELIRAIGLHDDLEKRVRSALRAHLPARPDAATIARSLNLSERSLRRRLAEQGCSYRQIRETEWAAFARRQLDRAGSTVAGVAEAMGFGDPREFRRAFKRWTGRTPREASAPAR